MPDRDCGRCPVGGEWNGSTQTCSVPDPDDGLPVACVGEWASEKHDRLKRYVDISRFVRKKFNEGQGGSAYIDLYCGPGRSRIERTDRIIDGGALCAAKEALGKDVPFQRTLISDKRAEFVEYCKQRLSLIGVHPEARVGSADAIAVDLRTVLDRFTLYFAFLDPYALGALPFSVVESLSRFKYMDILVHVSGQDLQRNFRRYLEASSSPLDVFSPGWRQAISHADTELRNRRAVLEHWKSKVRDLDMQPSQGIEEVRASKNQLLYWLMFVSRSPTADRFWHEIRAVGEQRDFGF